MLALFLVFSMLPVSCMTALPTPEEPGIAEIEAPSPMEEVASVVSKLTGRGGSKEFEEATSYTSMVSTLTSISFMIGKFLI